jgi:hypothetical protein
VWSLPVASSSSSSRVKGRQEKKTKKTADVRTTYVLYLARIELLYTYDDVICFIAFLSSPYRETPKNAQKKIGRGKKLDARPRKTFSPHREALNQRNKKIERKRS